MFKRFTADERAIEGLPIRLVIALVVGVASLSVMMSTLSGLETIGVTELDADPQPEVIGPGNQSVTVTVVTPEGEPVADATVIADGGTAKLDRTRTGTTGPNGTVSLGIDPHLGPNQDEGTVTLDVKPPASSQYTDKRENTKVLVVA